MQLHRSAKRLTVWGMHSAALMTYCGHICRLCYAAVDADCLSTMMQTDTLISSSFHSFYNQYVSLWEYKCTENVVWVTAVMSFLLGLGLIRRWDTRTWRDVSSCKITYLTLNYDKPVFPEYFKVTRTCYIYNGRRFTKSTFHVSLLSTFHLKMDATSEWPWRSFKVTAVAAIWQAIYDLQLLLHCKYISILHRFRDVNTYLPKG